MSPALLRATVLRILKQLHHDKRSIAMILGVPLVLLTLLYFMFESQPQVFSGVALIMLGIFPFFIMFLLTSVTMLRERTNGALERLFTTPIGKLDLLLGYGTAFGLAAAIQATLATTYAYLVLGLETRGSAWLVVIVAIINAQLGVALGLLASAFARTEFQAVQFMPLIALPQILLCGLFVPRDQMAGWLEGLSHAMPLAYSVEALQEVGVNASATSLMWRDIAIVVAVILVAQVLAAVTLRRRTT